MGHYFATKEKIKEYGANQWDSEKDKKPLFGRDFVKAPWNGKWAGKRVIRDSNDPKRKYQIDEWCYVNRFKGCVDYDERNEKKLNEYLSAEYDREEAERLNREKRDNIFAGKRTRKGVKKTRRLRRTRRR